MPDLSTETLAQNILAYLESRSLPPNPAWLSTFLPTIRASTPAIASQKTALFRILSTDLRASLDTARVQNLPRDVCDPQIRERHVAGPVVVQVLNIEDIGSSRWSQVEHLEEQKRGETTKGKEIVRVVSEETSGLDSSNHSVWRSGRGPYKLLLQDCAGTTVYGFEIERVRDVGGEMAIGAKVVLKGVLVARGMVMLTPATVEVLGGKVESWDRKWREERIEVLKEAVMKNGRDESR